MKHFQIKSISSDAATPSVTPARLNQRAEVLLSGSELRGVVLNIEALFGLICQAQKRNRHTLMRAAAFMPQHPKIRQRRKRVHRLTSISEPKTLHGPSCTLCNLYLLPCTLCLVPALLSLPCQPLEPDLAEKAGVGLRRFLGFKRGFRARPFFAICRSIAGDRLVGGAREEGLRALTFCGSCPSIHHLCFTCPSETSDQSLPADCSFERIS